MNKTCGIYLITCTKPNGDKFFYVGQSINIELRFGQHRYGFKAKRHPNQIMQRSWSKYGPLAFKFEILEECDQASLNDFENWWLGEMVGHRRCMNIGTEATAPMAGVKFSKEHCAKIAAAISGDKSYLFGKHHSDETKAKISAGGRGVKRGEITKKKISEANMGPKNSMFGKSGTQNARSKPVVGFPVGGGSPIRLASAHGGRKIGFSQDGISHCCSGRHASHKGFVWEFDVGQESTTMERTSSLLKPTRTKDGRFERWVPTQELDTCAIAL